MAMSSRRVFVAAIALGLAGCGMNQPIGTEDRAFGEAVKYDTALQTINPTPEQVAGAAQPGASGEMGAAAVKRYRTGNVKNIQPMQTTDTNTGTGTGMTSNPGYTPH
jgi:hypothetical protein